MKVTFAARMMRFQKVKAHTSGAEFTVVKVKYVNGDSECTIRKIRWSKYRFINKLIRLYLRVRYV